MNTLKTSIKTIALFFMTLTLFQSCVAYQNTPVSLLQAEQSKKRVKMKTSADQTFKFKQIVLEENQFYGLKKEKGEIVKIALHNNDANKVFLHNKGKSTWRTIAVIVVPLIVVRILAGAFTFNLGDDFFNSSSSGN
ncbi:MAG: hypothetical protein ACJART_002590 [Maribacter sp.]|jgi:hypothetical protein|tara:strand:- start:1295 stop:1702 length:408 start_codon:yes stop_codon:yes gene_type:complete